MKIAMVFDGLRYGGIERVGIDYIKIFQKLGYEVTIYNLVPSLSDMESQINRDCIIKHVSFPRWLAPERCAALLKETWWGKYIYPVAFVILTFINKLYKLFRIGEQNKYDIAIAFSGHMNDLTFVSKSFVKSTYRIAWLHGALYGYAIISPGFLRLYSSIKNLVSLSDSCDTELYEFIQENGINKQTIYNPIYIQDKKVDEAILNYLRDQYGDFCLMVARLDDDKDQKTVIDAMDILNKKYGIKKKVVFVGDGKNRKKLEQYVVDKKMVTQAFFVGKRADVQNFYSAATVYIHSSPLEGLPTVLLEAMSYHLPIASTDSIPGVREVLQNGKYGLISKIFDAEGLADNIYRLYTDKDLYEKFANLSDERILDFSPNVIEGKIKKYLTTLH